MVCAGRSGIDSCQGDSGDPILDANTGKQVGGVSWGFGCADPAYPGVNSRISAAYNIFIGPLVANWSNPPTSPPTILMHDLQARRLRSTFLVEPIWGDSTIAMVFNIIACGMLGVKMVFQGAPGGTTLLT